MIWPFRKSSTARCFSIGRFTLDAPLPQSTELREISAHEYAVMGRTFEDESIFHAPPEVFLDRTWNIDLGSVAGRIYKIAAYLEFRSKAEANPVAMQALSYCTEQLGKPAEQQTGFFAWDTSDGNVILQTAETAEGLAINLFETSRAVRHFKRNYETH
jgi:hypothetical protein